MKKLIGVAMIAGAAVMSAGAAQAGEVSANVSMSTDYVFRGVSLSDNDAVIQGGADYTADLWYAGVWGSSLSSGTELDAYAGFTPDLGGPVSLDVGAIGYFYPGAADDGAEFDYFELKGAADFAVNDAVSFGGAFYWSPENFGNTGTATYYEVNGTWAATETVEFSAAYGNQTIENPDGVSGGALEDDYNTWNVGGTMAMHGFNFGLRYSATDIETGDAIEAYTFGHTHDDKFTLTIGRDL